jgi:glycerophosphoryl diester phosphodiesterase
MIEFDLRFTRDGALALMHDVRVDRTTDGTGRFSDMTLDELRRLDAGVRKDARFAGTRIPTFEEALAIMPQNVWLNCHLRADNAELGAAAARAVAKAGRLHQAFLASPAGAAAAARKAEPKILICYMERQGNTVDYIDFSIARKADFIQLRGKGEVDAEQIHLLKKNGVR